MSCIAVGIIQVYSTLSICLWWFMLTAALFWKIWFPINARMCETRRQIKYIHITCVLIGTLVPLIPVISLMSIFADNSSSHSDFLDGGLGFSFTRSPPLPCYGSDLAVTFYTTIFPSNILLAIGITFIFLIFWRVHKVSYIQLFVEGGLIPSYSRAAWERGLTHTGGGGLTHTGGGGGKHPSSYMLK